MVKLIDMEDDGGDFVLDQQPDQGDCSFMSDDDEYLDGQSDQGEDGFMSSDDDDDSSLHERPASSDQEDDGSAMSDDGDSYLHEQSDQEDDGGFFDQEPDRRRQADDFFYTWFLGALRTFTERGFYTPGGAGGEDEHAGTFSEYYVFDLTASDGEDEDEEDAFPVPAPPAAASEAAVAALEAAEAPADDCCPVCLQDDGAAPGAAWTRVAACGHRFHAACMAQWLRVKLSCPVCRHPAGAAAAAAPTARPRDDAAEEPPRSPSQPLPDIVEEMLSVDYYESLLLERSSRWMEFLATYRR